MTNLSTKALTDQNVSQYARALIRMHGRRAPYFAALHAMARQESGEAEGSRLWLAVERATLRLIAQGTEETVH